VAITAYSCPTREPHKRPSDEFSAGFSFSHLPPQAVLLPQLSVSYVRVDVFRIYIVTQVSPSLKKPILPYA